jgi:hypothetical protein
MPRAAPGSNARGALRRDLPDQLHATVRYPDSCLVKCPCCPEMEKDLHRCGCRSHLCCSFTLQFSGLGVERGVLGEVVSLVGDCRPPPPGNPRQPTNPVSTIKWVGRRPVISAKAGIGSIGYISNKQKNGGVFLPIWVHCSLINLQISTNLKILNHQQYFKNNRSYFSCARKNHVLKFEHFPSHMCGFRDVEPPSIAITNVLGT